MIDPSTPLNQPLNALAARSLRIAFDHSHDVGWTGGIIYLQNLLGAIQMLDPSERPTTLLIERENDPKLNVPVDRRLTLPADAKRSLGGRIYARLLREAGVARRPGKLEALIQSEQIDVIFTDRYYPPGLKVPLIAWIADFQYLHLPEHVGPEQIDYSTQLNRQQIKQSKAIFVSSHDVLKDLKAFDPDAARRASVVHFTSQIPAEIYQSNPAEVCRKYSLPERFFYLPNQFWKHKNHLLVIKALQLLAQRSVKLNVVCTGNTFDHRHRTFFSSVLSEIAMAGLHEQIRILGLIPRADVFLLQRQSLAILQPSLFEGWSTSIEEAKAIGKRVVCSDLAVNKEQIPEADFFDRNDAGSLADCLQAVSTQASPGPDLAREALAREQLPLRTRQFARDFISVAQRAIDWRATK